MKATILGKLINGSCVCIGAVGAITLPPAVKHITHARTHVAPKPVVHATPIPRLTAQPQPCVPMAVAPVEIGSLSLPPSANTAEQSFGPGIGSATPIGLSFVEVAPGGPRNDIEVPAPAIVPEPGTWMLFIVGFGAIGAIVRRKFRKKADAL